MKIKYGYWVEGHDPFTVDLTEEQLKTIATDESVALTQEQISKFRIVQIQLGNILNKKEPLELFYEEGMNSYIKAQKNKTLKQLKSIAESLDHSNPDVQSEGAKQLNRLIKELEDDCEWEWQHNTTSLDLTEPNYMTFKHSTIKDYDVRVPESLYNAIKEGKV